MLLRQVIQTALPVTALALTVMATRIPLAVEVAAHGAQRYDPCAPMWGRNLTRLLDGEALLAARAAFAIDLDSFAIVLLDATVMSNAAQIAEATLCRSLDAVHLAAARRAGSNITVLTFDARQAHVAHQLGLATIGA